MDFLWAFAITSAESSHFDYHAGMDGVTHFNDLIAQNIPVYGNGLFLQYTSDEIQLMGIIYAFFPCERTI